MAKVTALATNRTFGGKPSADPRARNIVGKTKAATSTVQIPVTNQIREIARVRSHAHLRARIKPYPSQISPAATTT